MGLLDDAIREHLELKRRSGADPGEIARQEKAALEPVLGEEAGGAELATASALAPESIAQVATEQEGHFPADPEALEDQEHGTPAPDHGHVVGQETAEIDMRTVLEADVHEGHQGDPLGHEAIRPAPGGAQESEHFEWQLSGEDERPVPEEIPGQERMPFE